MRIIFFGFSSILLTLVLVASSFASLSSFDSTTGELVRLGATVRYYSVSGKTISEIRESMRNAAFTDPEGKPRDAYTSWEVRWKWPVEKGIEIDKIETSFSAEVTLPAWQDAENASLEVQKECNF